MNVVNNLCHCECWELNMKLWNEMDMGMGR